MSAAIKQSISTPMPEELVVIDNDVMFIDLVEKHFQDAGVNKIQTFSDSDAAWKFLSDKSKPVDFIVMDWQQNGLPGVGLFNRIKQSENFQDTPILIFSGTLEKEDFQLLGEWPLAHFLPKPFTQNILQKKFAEMLLEQKWQKENWGIFHSLLSTLKPRSPKENINKIKTHIAKTPNPVPTALLACRKLRENHFYVEAEEIAREVVFAEPNSILAKNELGKALILQGRHKEAGEALRVADQISPRNIERLCLLGEVGINNGNPVVAREMFNRALNIDPDASRPQAGLHMVEVVESNISQFRSGGESIAKNFASILNTVAISRIHAGEFAKGIEQYRSALTFLNARTTMAKLSFNLGLAYLKTRSLREAYPWFIQCLSLNPDMDKAKKYVARLRIYFKKLESGELVNNSSEAFEDENDDLDVEWE